MYSLWIRTDFSPYTSELGIANACSIANPRGSKLLGEQRICRSSYSDVPILYSSSNNESKY